MGTPHYMSAGAGQGRAGEHRLGPLLSGRGALPDSHGPGRSTPRHRGKSSCAAHRGPASAGETGPWQVHIAWSACDQPLDGEEPVEGARAPSAEAGAGDLRDVPEAFQSPCTTGAPACPWREPAPQPAPAPKDSQKRPAPLPSRLGSHEGRAYPEFAFPVAA